METEPKRETRENQQMPVRPRSRASASGEKTSNPIRHNIASGEDDLSDTPPAWEEKKGRRETPAPPMPWPSPPMSEDSWTEADTGVKRKEFGYGKAQR